MDDVEKMKKIEEEVIKITSRIESLGIRLMFQCIRCSAMITDFKQVPRHFLCKMPSEPLEAPEIAKELQHKKYKWIRITAQNKVLACLRCNKKTMRGALHAEREFIDKHKKCKKVSPKNIKK